MFLRLFSIETTRLTRRVLPWLILALSALYTGYNMGHYYSANQAQLMNGDIKMPGLSFDLATSLDQVTLISLPFLIILAAILMGNDYTQRTNQHWLMRAPRHTGLMAKFALLVGFSFVLHTLTLLVGGGIGWYNKTYVFNMFSLANVNGLATLVAPFYMTLTTLPYLAMMLLITVATRSTFAGALIGLGYTQFIEILWTVLLHDQKWMMWHPHNLCASVTYLLNDIGNKMVEVPDYLAQPTTAMFALLAYTLVFIAAALWLYQRQDVGG